jgi:hypothetical protein
MNATDALLTASDDCLLDAMLRLTHKVHALTEDEAEGLRAQRDLVRAEVLRRMGASA